MYYYDVLMRGARGPNPVLTYASKLILPAGQAVRAPLAARQAIGVVLKQTVKPAFKTKSLTTIDDVRLPQKNRQLVEWLSKYYGVSPAVALRLAIPAAWPKTIRPPERAKGKGRGLSDLKLSSAQSDAVKSILNGKSTTYLLHGATASGKTLVYRRLAEAMLAQGKSAIILVPEIALMPQVVADFSDLTEQVFVSHSALTSAQRQRIWLYCLQHTEPLILVGPRSTLFYPVSDIGLIVVDEAHEQSYKQEQSPNYQAQTVAAKLSQLHGAKLVLGSATPRISDYWQAKTRSVPIISLARHEPLRPTISMVDQTKSDDFNRSRILSDQLLDKLSQVLNRRGQSLLYLNRRGTASLAICADCGWVPLCPRCDLPASLHHDEKALICHQCGWRGRVPVNCPVCGSSELIYRGAGTKAVEREIQRLLPSARVGRFDSDNPKRMSFRQLYPDIYKRKTDILIGTQSLAVGMDLPGLELVGVVSADSELYLPDYTAGERAFQLLYQVIGRAGRQGGGEVIIQTHNPSHPAILNAVNQDYESFYKYEIAQRQIHGYPPFGFLMVAVVKAKSAAKAQQGARTMAATLARQFGLNRILGPAPAFYAKRGSWWRYNLVIKARQRAKLVEAGRFLNEQPNWQADIDPINLLV